MNYHICKGEKEIMTNLAAVQTALIIVIIYICVYGVVNRICKCIEYCSFAKSYEKIAEEHPELLDNKNNWYFVKDLF